MMRLSALTDAGNKTHHICHIVPVTNVSYMRLMRLEPTRQYRKQNTTRN